MGLYLRKSVNIGGGLRLNLSNSGVGVSAGVPGFRFGVNARGQHYVHCGTGGIYYRSNFGTTPKGYSRAGHSPSLGRTPCGIGIGPPQAIGSGSVSNMVDTSAAELVGEISTRHRRLRWHRWFLAASTATLLIGLGQNASALLTIAAVAAVLGTPFLWFVDRARKTVHINYSLDPTYSEKFRRLTQTFEGLRSCGRLWRISSEAQVLNRKYHAGASEVIERQALSTRLTLPPYFKSNLTGCLLPAGRLKLFFLPDTILIFDGRSAGSVGYGQLNMHVGTRRFVESGTPPYDAKQVGATWRFVNKNGGPDRRFTGNCQLPLMEYGTFKLLTRSGLCEEFHCSRTDLPIALELAIRAMAPAQGAPQVGGVAPPIAAGRTPWPKV